MYTTYQKPLATVIFVSEKVLGSHLQLFIMRYPRILEDSRLDDLGFHGYHLLTIYRDSIDFEAFILGGLSTL